LLLLSDPWLDQSEIVERKRPSDIAVHELVDPELGENSVACTVSQCHHARSRVEAETVLPFVLRVASLGREQRANLKSGWLGRSWGRRRYGSLDCEGRRGRRLGRGLGSGTRPQLADEIVNDTRGRQLVDQQSPSHGPV